MEKPQFIESLDKKYGSRTGNIFLLHGNIHDLFPAQDGTWQALPALLVDELSRENRIFIHVDLSGGISLIPVWPSSFDELPQEEQKKLAEELKIGLETLKNELPKNQAYAESVSAKLAVLRRSHCQKQLEFIRKLCGETTRQGINGERETVCRFDALAQESILSSFAALTLAKEIFSLLQKHPQRERWRLIFLIRDVGTLAPAQPEASLSESDRRNIQLLKKWFGDADFLQSRHAMIMTSETVEDVNAKLKNFPQVHLIKISRPDLDARKNFLSVLLAGANKNEVLIAFAPGLTVDDFVEATAGLTLQDIEQIILAAKFSVVRNAEGKIVAPVLLSLDAVGARSREVMEQSAGGHIEFVELRHGLSEVIGQSCLKPLLLRQAKIFRSGKKLAIPSGILIVGPNGSGKSYVIAGFAKDTGWHVIRLKNIRNMWYGETERIWEVIEEIIEAIGRVIILVDEGDTELGGRGRDVHEVDKRLFGKILRMMEDKKNKGRVCWFIITARPDKLEPDLKRSGRAGRHYPIFAPETEAELLDFMEKVVLARFGLSRTAFPDPAKLLALTAHYYPADFDELVEHCEELRESGEKNVIGADDLIAEAEVLKPSDPILQRKLQIYVALLECTDMRLVPDQYLYLAENREKLVQEIITLKQLLGEIA